jgi:uncharacterized protein involved in tolerance to divalent cations
VRFETSVIYLRIMHAVIKNIYVDFNKSQQMEDRRVDLQKVKLPEMIPFAIATGKIAYASWVNGS